MSRPYGVENLDVYQRLCRLHIEVCELTAGWPTFERFELCSQIRRASNSAPANLAEKHNDRHMRNRIEGVNRARGEAIETIHHLYIAKLKGYVREADYSAFRTDYFECVRMLNGLEKAYERGISPADRRWTSGVREDEGLYEPCPPPLPRLPEAQPDEATTQDSDL